MFKLVVVDLDGTLLRSDKSISDFTLKVLKECRNRGLFIAIATARSEINAREPIAKVQPNIIISSSGALVSYRGDYIYSAGFSAAETRRLIDRCFDLAGTDCEISVDTKDAHYWNYKADPGELYPDYPDTVYTDYRNFYQSSLKLCLNTADYEVAQTVSACVPDCSYKKFSDGDWFQFTKSEATKGAAVKAISQACGVPLKEIISFGDDFVDICMLELCGRGIAVANAIPEVKAAADDLAESNDRDGVAKYLKKYILR